MYKFIFLVVKDECSIELETECQQVFEFFIGSYFKNCEHHRWIEEETWVEGGGRGIKR